MNTNCSPHHRGHSGHSINHDQPHHDCRASVLCTTASKPCRSSFTPVTHASAVTRRHPIVIPAAASPQTRAQLSVSCPHGAELGFPIHLLNVRRLCYVSQRWI
ncbi:hypothetical protein M0R45_001580 [Rubus argutus]|uniref:Uncharacterized protein n=1 Tax=Rubus argutus TaxID=59490 RepID=A0AAW1VKB0_RUBAR